MYGNFVEGLSKKDDKYGFVNETKIRIAAGITLAFAVYSFISIVFFAAFAIPTFLITVLWLDFALKVFVSPNSSIFYQLALLIPSSGQYWVGALQKRFAWSIGLVLSTFVFICIYIISGLLPSMGIAQEVYTLIQELPILYGMAIPFSPPILICIICIIFMTLEAVFGYCVGCKMYQKLVQWGVMKKIEGQNCAGGVCAM